MTEMTKDTNTLLAYVATLTLLGWLVFTGHLHPEVLAALVTWWFRSPAGGSAPPSPPAGDA